MHLTAITGGLLLSSTLALCRPSTQRRDASLGCLYMTTEANWQGEGENICETPGTCGKSDFHSR